MPLCVADTEIMEKIRQDQDIVLIQNHCRKIEIILFFSLSKACLPKKRFDET